MEKTFAVFISVATQAGAEAERHRAPNVQRPGVRRSRHVLGLERPPPTQ